MKVNEIIEAGFAAAGHMALLRPMHAIKQRHAHSIADLPAKRHNAIEVANRL